MNRVAPPTALRTSAGLVLVAAAVSLALCWTADQLARDAHVKADGVLDRVVLSQFGAYRAERGGRGIRGGSCVSLEGWSSTPVALFLEIGAADQGRPIRIRTNRRSSFDRLATLEPRTHAVSSTTDAQGVLRVCFEGTEGEPLGARLVAIAMRHESRGAVPLSRALQYALLGGGLALLMRRRCRALLVLLTALGLGVVVGVAIVLARLQVLPLLPWVAGAGVLLWAWLALAEVCASTLQIPSGCSRWLVLATALRIALIVDPSFCSVDAWWHIKNTRRLLTHGIVASEAPGFQRVPYPPALYAILGTIVTPSDQVHAPISSRDDRIIRLAMGLLECSAPLLVLAIMRAAGASAAAAGAGAVAMAVMPEGLLVLAKGVAANIFGAYIGLLLVLALLRKTSSAVLTALMALALLAHAPAAVTTFLLLGLWSFAEYRDGRLSSRELIKRGLAFLVAAGVAWLVYYRETALVLDTPGVTIKDPAFFYVRWYRVGKVGQDLFLKFGGAPVVLAFLGLRALASAPALKPLLRSWFAVGFAFAALAVASAFPLRFEYFLLPAVAMAAGIGAEWLNCRRGQRLVQAAFAVSFLIQAVIGWFHYHGQFGIIAVIMESSRWPFPFVW